MSQQKGANRKERGVRREAKRVQVQEFKENSFPEGDCSKPKASNDGQLRSSLGGHKPAEIDRDNVVKIHKNNRELNLDKQ